MNLSRRSSGRWVGLLVVAWVLAAPGSGRAEVDGVQLREFAREAEAFNAEKADANRYRAGFFYGYVNGVLDALNGRSVCFTACRCELEPLVNGHYARHPEDLDKPAGPVLVRLLERHYPCGSP